MVELDLIELSKIETLRLIHLFVCSIGALFLILLWKRAVAVDPSNKNDIGLLLLAGAFLMWVFIDAYRFTGLMKPGESSLMIKTFSAYNNAFFIASLPFFGNSFKWVRTKIKIFESKSRWALAILVSNIGLVMLYSMVWKNEKDSGAFVNYIDLIYSILTYILLSMAIISRLNENETLRKTTLPIGILLSASLILIQAFFSPLFTITHYDLLSVAAMICHTLLAILLISLGYEWLLKIQTSLVIEKNRSNVIIQSYVEKNESLQEELDQLRSQTSNDRTLSVLTERELVVLKHINQSYTEIGNKLFISRDTVITHKKNIEAKLGISGKKQLEEFAENAGLISKK